MGLHESLRICIDSIVKLKRDKNYYIYYMTSGTNSTWKKYSGNSDVSDAKDADVTAVIDDHLSKRVEIQLEKENSATPYIQFDHDTDKNVTVGPPDSDIIGYKGYKHTINGGLKIEKISHGGNEIRGIADLDKGTPIENVSTFWVFYEKNDDGRSKPLILCYNSNSANNWYHRGVKWNDLSWNIAVPTNDLSYITSNATDKTKVTSKLDAIFYRQDNHPL